MHNSYIHNACNTYAFVMENLLCLPDESRKTFALTTLRPKFFNAFICNPSRELVLKSFFMNAHFHICFDEIKQ